MDNEIVTHEQIEPTITELNPEDNRRQKMIMAVLIVGVIVLLALVILAVVLLMRAPEGVTGQIRDVFIIFMALESLLLGLVLIVLIIQIARLTNLLQNEIKPILDSTNETISTLRGTTAFLSENLIEPVIKLNEYAAALSQVAAIFGLAKKKNRTGSNSK
jgi:nitrate reductase gamma subunit